MIFCLHSQQVKIADFAEQNLYIGKWSAPVDILVNHNNYTGSKLNVYPDIRRTLPFQ